MFETKVIPESRSIAVLKKIFIAICDHEDFVVKAGDDLVENFDPLRVFKRINGAYASSPMFTMQARTPALAQEHHEN